MPSVCLYISQLLLSALRFYNMIKSRKSDLCVITAGVLWGIIGIFIKNLSAGGLDSFQITGIKMAIAAPFYVLFLLVKDKSKLKVKLKDIWIFVGTGVISVTLFSFCYFYTMVQSEASLAVVLLYTSPIFIMILSAVLFREKITLRKIIALILTFSGCVLVAGVLGGGYRITPVILLTGLCSGLFYGLYTIFGTFGLRKYDTLTVTAYTFIFGFISTVPFSRPVETVRTVVNNPRLLIFCAGVSIICTVLPYFFYTKGLEGTEACKASILVAVEPLIGSVIGMTFFKESHSILKIAGIILILTAIVILNTSSEKHQQEVKK